MNEKCGVVAIASRNRAAESIFLALMALQHRGQEAAGIAVFDEGIKNFRGLGLVQEAFREFEIDEIEGNVGIGHVYYSVKISAPENAQPTLLHTHAGDIAIAHNGIITNSEKLKKELMEKGYIFYYGNEEEAIAYLLADYLKNRSVEKAVKQVMKKIEGSYSFTFMIDNRVFGLRDPLGIKPLCIGKFENGYIIASESVAIDVLGGEIIRDVEPGELVEITPDGYRSYKLMEEKHRAHCFFEYVYFARADSIIDGVEVYRVRERLGEILAREQPADADYVVPIPDSGRAHAYGYSKASGIPLAEGLMKNRYIARTFILPTQKIREKLVQLKLNPVKSIVDGNRIVLVDDSIVRGTTMRKIVSLLRRHGAREVHIRIASPPIMAPCYFGIDMTTREQLIASGKSIEEIREKIGADSLGYISVDGMVKAIGMEKNDLCLGCVTAEYPVKIEGEKFRFQERIEKWEED
ncbi:MAG TPA: amidophosphoribosyltransferase [Thermoplasmatales archaeon]|nr:amidophosphoribosyltransferase [Thermoplasmatales archaeon]